MFIGDDSNERYYMVISDYLARFGYATLAALQHDLGLKCDGIFGRVTEAAVTRPRCGVRETTHVMQARAKRDWSKDPLLYDFTGFVATMPAEAQQRLTAEAVADWNALSPIKARRVRVGERPEITIGAGRGKRHGFDGPGRVLAWAELAGGRMMFDADEDYGTSGGSVRYKNVCSHEWGHILGLDHSRIHTALMAPYYDPDVATPQSPDDVERLQRMYGQPKDGGGNDPVDGQIVILLGQHKAHISDGKVILSR